ncbi:MAG: RNA polymerase sigma factor [Calditrichaeota bacterium]|nr:MAG: RNA polymerase sigma factor [Calditrichota bacterium]
MEQEQVRELVKQAKEGDHQAFAQLFFEYSDRVYNLALKILKNPEDAADVVQETFSTVFQKIHTFDGRSNFFTWLYRIATNFSLMKWRQYKRAVFTDQDLENTYDAPANVEPQHWDQIALNDVLNEEFRRHLDEAIDSLPEIYRSVFILRDLENLSIKETSKILGITESNVKIRLKRARMFLRDKLSEYMSELVEHRE